MTEETAREGGEPEPRIHPDVFLAQGATVVGDVEILSGSSIWFGAVVRGDTASIRIGARTNVQDRAVLHTDAGLPCLIGDDCTIGHGSIVHACTVGDRCLVGMGAIILSGVQIGEESLVAAGSLILEGRRFPARSLIMGSPAEVARTLTDEEVEALILGGSRNYVRLAAEHGSGRWGAASRSSVSGS